MKIINRLNRSLISSSRLDKFFMSQCDRGARANENVEEADAVVGPFTEDGVYTLRVPIMY